MWIDRLTYSPTTAALELTARFAEQRQRVLAENVANIDTPNYHARRLDPERFQASLSAALKQAREKPEAAGAGRLSLRDNAQFSQTADGRVEVRPDVEPASNVLFQDGTNACLEELLSDVAQNALSYELATNLLRTRFESLLSAIRGRVT